MSLLLNIDTATENASICISEKKNVLALERSKEQKDHASFIQPAIKRLCSSLSIQLNSIDAVAATAGPGSYTGLRVGLSTAKGLCYALQKPLILINTLEVMAIATIEETEQTSTQNSKLKTQNTLFCPMIDARRMEVFTAAYNKSLEIILPPAAIILNENSFKEYLSHQKIFFSGSGMHKFSEVTNNANAFFLNTIHDARHLAHLAAVAFEQQRFADLAYSEPFYIKEFFTHTQHPQ